MFAHAKQVFGLIVLLFGAAEALKCWECQEHTGSFELHQCDEEHSGISKECGPVATCQVDELRENSGKIIAVSKHCFTHSGGDIGDGDEENRCKSWTEAPGVTRHFCSCHTDNCNEFGIDGIAEKPGEVVGTGGADVVVQKPTVVSLGLVLVWILVHF